MQSIEESDLISKCNDFSFPIPISDAPLQKPSRLLLIPDHKLEQSYSSLSMKAIYYLIKSIFAQDITQIATNEIINMSTCVYQKIYYERTEKLPIPEEMKIGMENQNNRKPISDLFSQLMVRNSYLMEQIIEENQWELCETPHDKLNIAIREIVHDLYIIKSITKMELSSYEIHM